MTTTARKTGRAVSAKKPAGTRRKASAPKKPLRIRPDLLPETARYITVDDVEYIAMPVVEFGEWYEDVTLGAVAQDRLENSTEPPIPLEDFLAKSATGTKRKAKK